MYPDDHPPPHVHATASEVTLIIDLLEDGAIRLADAWPDLDLDHYLPSLMKGTFGSDLWMQALQRRTVAA